MLCYLLNNEDYKSISLFLSILSSLFQYFIGMDVTLKSCRLLEVAYDVPQIFEENLNLKLRKISNFALHKAKLRKSQN